MANTAHFPLCSSPQEHTASYIKQWGEISVCFHFFPQRFIIFFFNDLIYTKVDVKKILNSTVMSKNAEGGLGLPGEFGNQHAWVSLAISSSLEFWALWWTSPWPVQLDPSSWSRSDWLPWVVTAFPGVAGNSCISSTKWRKHRQPCSRRCPVLASHCWCTLSALTFSPKTVSWLSELFRFS